MQKELFESTINNLREIRELVERGNLKEDKYPLHIFRYEGGTVSQLIAELKEC